MEYGGNKTASEGPAFAGLDEMIQIALHGLEHKVKFLGVWKEKEIVQGNDIGMKRNCAQRLKTDR